MDIMGLIQHLLQQSQPQQAMAQGITSPLPQNQNPGGFNSPLQPGLNAYYQREAQANAMGQGQGIKNYPSPTPTPTPSNIFADFTTSKVPPQFSGIIAQAAQQYGVNPNVLASLLFSEHGFQSTGAVRNSDGSFDRGIAQINDRAHPEVSDQQAQDPTFSIPWAAKILGGHIKNLGLQRGIVAYNTGDEGSKSIPDPSQHPYYKKVTAGLSQKLRQQLGL